MKQVATSIVDVFDDIEIENSNKKENLKKKAKTLLEHQT